MTGVLTTCAAIGRMACCSCQPRSRIPWTTAWHQHRGGGNLLGRVHTPLTMMATWRNEYGGAPALAPPLPHLPPSDTGEHGSDGWSRAPVAASSGTRVLLVA
jgi:hypothetical protein